MEKITITKEELSKILRGMLDEERMMYVDILPYRDINSAVEDGMKQIEDACKENK